MQYKGGAIETVQSYNGSQVHTYLLGVNKISQTEGPTDSKTDGWIERKKERKVRERINGWMERGTLFSMFTTTRAKYYSSTTTNKLIYFKLKHSNNCTVEYVKC